MTKTNQRRRYVEKLPHEVFALMEEATKVGERVKILQEHESFAIKTILQGAFSDSIVFDLPDGAPPYTVDTAPAGLQIVPLKKCIRMLARTVVNAPTADKPEIARIKKQSYFIRLLESVHAKDAEILIAMKDKRLTELYKSVTQSVVKKAFPGLLS